MDLMKCGHSANARTDKGEPACAICGCTEITNVRPDLTGRKARCTYYGRTFMYKGKKTTCCGEVNSNYNLPFFKYAPNRGFDEYYCGCWGWD